MNYLAKKFCLFIRNHRYPPVTRKSDGITIFGRICTRSGF